MDKTTIITWALNALVVVTGSFVGYYGTVIDKSIGEAKEVIESVGSQVVDHEARLIKIEASRFTYEDGKELRGDVADVKRDIAVINSILIDRNRRLESIEQKLDRIIDKIEP